MNDGDDEGMDDAKDMEDGEAALFLNILRQEMEERANDLQLLKDVISSEDAKQELDKMNEQINERQEQMVQNLEELNCNTQPIKQSNDEYTLNLSKFILHASAKQNAIQKINDGFLKELNGRLVDLNEINNVYYDETVSDEKIDFSQLKSNVDLRHEVIFKEIGESRVI